LAREMQRPRELFLRAGSTIARKFAPPS